jgi:hypothetical protein
MAAPWFAANGLPAEWNRQRRVEYRNGHAAAPVAADATVDVGGFSGPSTVNLYSRHGHRAKHHGATAWRKKTTRFYGDGKSLGEELQRHQKQRRFT